MLIEAVIFDADGVLVINSHKFSAQLQKDYNVPVAQTLPFFQGKFQECLVGTADLKEEIAPYLSGWGWKGSVDEFMQYWFKTEHNIDEPLVEYIKELKRRGIKIFVGTNNEKYRTEYLIESMGFGEIFNKVYGAGHIGFKKPNPDFFQYIVRAEKLNKNKTILWDDDPENIEGALRAGIRAEVYVSFEDFKEKMEKYPK